MAIDPSLLTAAGIEGVVVGTCVGIAKVIPAVARAVKGNGRNGKKPLECKPGKAQICIERGLEIKGHEGLINQLASESADSKKDRGEIKTKIDNGFSAVHRRLDAVLLERTKN